MSRGTELASNLLTLLSATKKFLLEEFDALDQLQEEGKPLQQHDPIAPRQDSSKGPPLLPPAITTPPAPKKQPLKAPVVQKPLLSEPRPKEATPKTLSNEAREPAHLAQRRPFALNAPPTPPHDDLQDLHPLIQRLMPKVRIRSAQSAPRDSAPSILLLSRASPTGSRPPVDEALFLTRLCNALQGSIAPALLSCPAHSATKEEWDRLLGIPSLKLILLSEEILEATPLLKESFQPHVERLGTLRAIPAYLLRNPCTYIEEPALKRELWNSLLGLAQQLGLRSGVEAP